MTSTEYEWSNREGLDRGILEEIAPGIHEGDYQPPSHVYRTVVFLNHRFAEGIYA